MEMDNGKIERELPNLNRNQIINELQEDLKSNKRRLENFPSDQAMESRKDTLQPIPESVPKFPTQSDATLVEMRSDNIPSRAEVVAGLLCSTGIRRSEVCGLIFKDINVE